MKRHSRIIIPLLIAALVMVSAGIAGTLLTGGRVKSRLISFQVEPGITASGILTVPASVSLNKPAEGGATRPPVIFLLPGIISLADRFEPAAGELGRHGYASLAIYFPNDNSRLRLKTVQAAARYIEGAFPQLNSTRRAYYGHSLGGTTAVDAAYFDDNAYAAVSVGYYIGGELAGSPKNLLIGTGIYDDLNDRDKLRSSIRSITEGRIAREGIMEGSFTDRTARELFISPCSNHASEKEDGYVVRRLIKWLDLSFHGQESSSYSLVYPLRALSSFLVTAGFFVLLCAAGIAMQRKGMPLVKPLWFSFYSTVAVISVIWPTSPPASLRALSVIVISLCVVMYFSEKEKRKGEHYDALEAFGTGFISIAGKIFLFALAFSLSQFIFGIPLFIEDQHFLSTFPAYLYYTFFITGCCYIDGSISYARHFLPIIWIGFTVAGFALTVIESLRPGRTLSAFIAIYEKLSLFLKFRKAPHVPLRQKITLAVLSILVVLSWLWLYRSGLLYGEIMKTYILFILRYGFLPIVFYGMGDSMIQKMGMRHMTHSGPLTVRVDRDSTRTPDDGLSDNFSMESPERAQGSPFNDTAGKGKEQTQRM
ncbi:MAG: hypothetical protein AB2L14_37060 [Candidatus Xenobiia bacterium LiM19]